MKQIIIALALILISKLAYAQCSGKVIGSEVSDVLGSVELITQYTINGQPVDVDGIDCDNCSQTSGLYDEAQGSKEYITALTESDRKLHCDNIMYGRLPIEAKLLIVVQKLIHKKEKNLELQNELSKLINSSIQKTEKVEIYKDLEIKIDADKKVTITNTAIVTP